MLRLFVDVKKNEVEPAFLFFLFWFFAIIVFQVLRPLKAGMFVEHYGARVELYAKLGNIGVAILAVVVFTALYNKLGSRRLIPTLCGFFILALLGFSAILRGDEPAALTNWTFYWFGDVWSTIWVTTFWAYLNEMTETEQSKRLYGLIGGGGVIGGLLGSLVVWQLVEPFGTSILLVGCALATALIGLVAWRAEVLAARPDSAIGREVTDETAAPTEKSGKMNAAVEGAKLVMTSKYLLAIVAMVFLYELVSQILDYQYKTAAETLVGSVATQAFLGQIGTIVGAVSVVTQFFLVSLVIRRFGITTALFVLPVAMAVASGIYFATPALWAAALLTVSDNSFSYSMNQTARETLFVPTSPDVKYKARAFANMFVQRFGKGIAILMALMLGMFPIRFLSLLAFGVIVIWAGFALYAGRRFEGLTQTREGLG